jgi:hypothetical protein
MKITILNGDPGGEGSGLDAYLARLAHAWQAQGHQVDNITLRELNLAYCIGCFGCWVKQPGECISDDDSAIVRQLMIASDLTLWASPVVMGFLSAKTKQMMDKMLPLIHPYIILDQGEMHHRACYAHYPQWGLVLEKRSDTDEEDIQIITAILQRTALNGKTRLAFTHTIDDGRRRAEDRQCIAEEGQWMLAQTVDGKR